jgi:phosphoribosylanthranilate isomerase
MKIKLCGMREAANIAEVARLAPDFMGFIFYEPSPRYAGEMPPEALDALLPATKRVGVFVNAPKEQILETAQKYALDLVQLHGVEPPEMCAALRAGGLGVIKAFGIGRADDVRHAAAYDGTCDYYVFDTAAGAAHGGTGRKFDHSLLRSYSGNTPYLLSGGLGPEDTPALASAACKDPRCVGVDINSRFETAPGTKDHETIKQFMKTIKHL